MNQSSPRDRAIGALVGLAVGDAVGTTLEFKRPGSFEPITEMVGGGPFGLEPGQWTDDTTMAMCMAESLIDRDCMDLEDQMRRYVLWRDEGYWSVLGRCFDMGGATTKAIERFDREGTIIDAHIDQEAAANGSLMRLAPVPIRWYTDIEIASEMSAISSTTTHPADRPVDACRVYGAMIAALIQGQDFDSVVSSDFWQGGSLHPAVATVIGGSWTQKEPPEIRGTGYVVDALEASIWAVARSTNFRDAVLAAANLGDDADTTAAIAGQLAGARWGVSGIPKEWCEKISFSERVHAIAGQLFDRAGTESDLPEQSETDAPDEPYVGEHWAYDRFIHAYWADPKSLLAGEYPGDLGEATAFQKINLLIDMGVRTFVDLTEADELMEYESIVRDAQRTRGLDLQYVRHPIPDFNVIDQDGYTTILKTIQDRIDAGITYVHCWGGIGRTGTVVGCYLVENGLSAEAALEQIQAARSQSRKARIRSPESFDQANIIRDRAAAK